jgi:hypothetical protein
MLSTRGHRISALTLAAAVAVSASCGTAGPSGTATGAPPSPTSAAPASPGTPSSPAAASSALPSGSPTTPALTGGRWEAAAPMSLGRRDVQAVRLSDGSVLVVGSDGGGCVRADSVVTEVYEPSTATWSTQTPLNAPRAQFALVPAGSGALVAGGVNAGQTTEGGQENHRSYSSAYMFDPAQAAKGWLRQSLLVPARTAPIAAPLADGRVLVAGGYYLAGSAALELPTARLAAYAPGGCPAPTVAPADVEPPTPVVAYATASVFNPATGAWSNTGAMRYARVGSTAATLTDGRVLVVGADTQGPRWNYTEPTVAERARTTAEVWDPKTGRFTLTGAMPPVDWSPLQQWGPYPVTSDQRPSGGTLVVLPGGDALLVGQAVTWYVLDVNRSGTIVRTMRFHGADASWSVVDTRVEADGADVVGGHSRAGMLASALPGGRVLLAGGETVRGDAGTAVATAELYSPADDSFAPLPPMPVARSGATGVALEDGSVLVMGGLPPEQGCPEGQDCDCGSAPNGSTSVVRFVPGS